LRRTHELIAACSCDCGCPSCVGPAGEKSERTKEAALGILEKFCSACLTENAEDGMRAPI
jgi:hypothetical protein